MALTTAEAAHVDAIAVAVAATMAAKTEGQRYTGDKLGDKLTLDILEATKVAAKNRNFANLATYTP